MHQQERQRYTNSVWHYKPGRFREFLNRITDKSIIVSEALATWREIPSLSKDFKEMTIEKIVKDPKLM
jgi:hypothetical protein